MHKQHGFTLGEFMLALAVASLVLAATVPALFHTINTQRQQYQLYTVVDDTLQGMTFALTSHWQDKPRCRTAPASLTVATLINTFHAPKRLNEAPWPMTLTFKADTTGPFIVRNLIIDMQTDSPATAKAAANGLHGHDYWVTVNGNTLTVTQPIAPITSLVAQGSFNTQTGCMEE